MNLIKNTQEIKEIHMYPDAITKCELGGDWYTNHLHIKFVPGEYYPDYTEVRTWISENINGTTRNIEDVVADIREFLEKTYMPRWLRITDHVTGCTTHFDVDVMG